MRGLASAVRVSVATLTPNCAHLSSVSMATNRQDNLQRERLLAVYQHTDHPLKGERGYQTSTRANQ